MTLSINNQSGTVPNPVPTAAHFWQAPTGHSSLAPKAIVRNLALHCFFNNVTCITFNYDDVIDEALYKTVGGEIGPGPYWNPDGGYGFFCRPAASLIATVDASMGNSKPYLLKLRGSANWRIRRGLSEPYGPEALVHSEDWCPPYSVTNLVKNINIEASKIETHLEPDAFIIPPVLTKSDLLHQPVLRIIWKLAFDELRSATHVTFVGYSLPITDLAARFLFKEAILREATIRVVSVRGDEKQTLRAYKQIFPQLGDNDFDFGGAAAWARSFPNEYEIRGLRSKASP
jgi:hypothetical protein